MDVGAPLQAALLALSLGLVTVQSSVECNCLDVWQPVCGTNGQTYSNKCYADCAAAAIAHKGECRTISAGEATGPSLAISPPVSSNPETAATVPMSNASIPVQTNAKVETLQRDVMASMAEYHAAQQAEQAFAMTRSGRRRVLFFEKPSSVCYGELGCFSRVGNMSNLGRLPQSPNVVKTGFHLYTSANQTVPEYLDYSNSQSISQSQFRAGKPTVFVIHGFGESGKAGWITKFQSAIFAKHPLANFIAVDWHFGAHQPDYWQAAANTQLTAAQIAKLLAVIHEVTKTSMDQVHLIGFSLGGQVAGLTSSKLVEFGMKRVGRITGLDPAGPIFEGAHPAGRIDETDADFVQAIHGNGASLLSGSFGIFQRVGHQDFYPNGGKFQPGCPDGLWDSVIESVIDIKTAVTTVSCNHFRATAYVLEALGSTCRFPSFPCASYEKYLDGECFGNEAVALDIFAEPKRFNEPLYFITNSDATYCGHTMRVTAAVADQQISRKGSLVFKLKPLKPNAEATKYTTLEGTDFASGKTVHDILFGRLSLDDLTNATIEYAPTCRGPLPCGGNGRVVLKSLTVEETGGNRRMICGPMTLWQGDALALGDDTADSCLI